MCTVLQAFKLSIFLCAAFSSLLNGPARWLHVGGGGEGRANPRGKSINRWRNEDFGIYREQGFISLCNSPVRYDISSCIFVYLPITCIICEEQTVADIVLMGSTRNRIMSDSIPLYVYREHLGIFLYIACLPISYIIL